MVGSQPTLGFQQVEDPTPGKNRLHFDGGGSDREKLVTPLRQWGLTSMKPTP